MGVDLRNKAGREFRTSHGWWGWLLRTAFDQGWRPADLNYEGSLYGLPAPTTNAESNFGFPCPKIDHYMANGGQEVSAEDAHKLVEAVEQASQDGKADDHSQTFIEFAKQGAFRIF